MLQSLRALLVFLGGCLPGRGAAVTVLPADGPVVLVAGEGGPRVVNPDTGAVATWTLREAYDPAQLVLSDHVVFAGRLSSVTGTSALLPTPAGGREAALSPEGGAVAYLATGQGMASSVRICALDGSDDRLLMDGAGSPTWLSADQVGLRDGDQFSGSRALRVPVAGGAPSLALDGGERALRSLAWSAGGARVIAAASGPGDRAGERRGLILSGTDGPATVLYDAGSGGDVWEPRLSPDGTRLAFLARAPSVGAARSATLLYVGEVGGPFLPVLDLAPGEPRLLGGGAAAGVGSYAWSPDGSRLVFLAAMAEDCRKNGNGELICRYDLYVTEGGGARKVAKLGLPQAGALGWVR